MSIQECVRAARRLEKAGFVVRTLRHSGSSSRYTIEVRVDPSTIVTCSTTLQVERLLKKYG